MSMGSTQDLADFLQRKADDYLRSVIHYEGETYNIVFLRDDVKSGYSDEDVEEIVEELFWEGYSTPLQESVYPHGELNCTIRCFENVVGMHFPHDDTAGTAVSMDAQAARDLYSFVGDCLTVIGPE